MDEDEVVLSDVHINKIIKPNSKTYHLSRFVFKCSESNQTKSSCVEYDDINNLTTDSDGDFILPNAARNCEVICIYHEMKSTLPMVGLQVWRGALFMCDYIASKQEHFYEKRVLELGCGVGLTGIFASQFASLVVCTDYDPKIVDLCRKNIEYNSIISGDNYIKTELLDWFNFKGEELLNLYTELPNVIIICDCIYDDELTNALFGTIYNIIQFSKKLSPTHLLFFYISLEKRLNFTLEDRDVTCRQYDYFISSVKQLKSLCKMISFDISINVLKWNDVPPCFEYEKVKQLELWTISV